MYSSATETKSFLTPFLSAATMEIMLSTQNTKYVIPEPV